MGLCNGDPAGGYLDLRIYCESDPFDFLQRQRRAGIFSVVFVEERGNISQAIVF